MEIVRNRWRDPSLFTLFLLIPVIIPFCIVQAYLGIIFVQHFWPDRSIPDAFDGVTGAKLRFLEIYAVTFGPMIEECIFRFVPLALSSWSKNRWHVAIAIGISSFAFGLVHGGYANLPIQGISGVVFSLVFLKWSGWLEDLGKGLFASTAVHIAFNTTALWLA